MKPTDRTTYNEGDLVEVIRAGSFTICYTLEGEFPGIRECPVQELEVYTHPKRRYENIFLNLEGKAALIVYVSRNKLLQPVGYRVLIEGKEMFCKSIVAEKYFKLIGTQGNAIRRSGKI